MENIQSILQMGMYIGSVYKWAYTHAGQTKDLYIDFLVIILYICRDLMFLNENWFLNWMLHFLCTSTFILIRLFIHNPVQVLIEIATSEFIKKNGHTYIKPSKEFS